MPIDVIAHAETIVSFNRPGAILPMRRSQFACPASGLCLRISGKGHEMDIPVRLGPGLLQRIGTSRLTLSLPDGATVRDALGSLRETYPGLLLNSDTMLTVVNGATVSDQHILRSGAELALLFPVSGGAIRND